MDLLRYPSREQENQDVSFHNDWVKVYLPIRMLDHGGSELTKTGIRFFNSFAESIIKDKLHGYLDLMTATGMRLSDAIGHFQNFYGFTEITFDSETIRKSYQRYRMKAGLPLLRKFSNPRSGRIYDKIVPSLLTQHISANG
jgi:hypothetical protein